MALHQSTRFACLDVFNGNVLGQMGPAITVYFGGEATV